MSKVLTRFRTDLNDRIPIKRAYTDRRLDADRSVRSFLTSQSRKSGEQLKTLTFIVLAMLIAATLSVVSAQSSAADDEVQKYTKALGTNPNNARLYTMRAAALVDAGKHDAALADTTRAIEIDPKMAEAYAVRGLAYERKGDDAKAMLDYTAAINQRPGFYYAFRLRGLLAKKLGNYSVASIDLMVAMTPNRSDAYLLSELADIKMRRKLYDQAITEYSKVIELKPDELRYWERRMEVYEATGKPELIWKDYEKLLIQHSDKPGVLYSRARKAFSLERFDIAVSDYSALIKLYPGDTEFVTSRARTYRSAGDYDLSIADYTSLITLKPTDAGLLKSRAFTHSEKGDHEASIADYTAAIKLDPKAEDAFTGRAWAFIEQGKLVPALADANKALQLFPKYFNLFYTRGYIYLLMSRKDPAKRALALADFDKAISINPKALAGYHGRSELFIEQKKYTAAVDEATRIVELSPEVPTGWLLRGIANYHANRKDAALVDLDRGFGLNKSGYLRKVELAKAYSLRAELNCAAGLTAEAAADEEKARSSGGNVKKCSAAPTPIEQTAPQTPLDPEVIEKANKEILEYTYLARKNPNNPTAYTFRGSSYEDIGQDDKALADYNKAVEVAPAAWQGYIFRARFYRKRARYGLAIPDFSKAIERAPESVIRDFIEERGQAYRQAKQFALALADAKFLNTPAATWHGDQLRIMTIADQGKLAMAHSELKIFQTLHNHPNPALIAFLLCKAGKKAEAAEYEATLADYEVLEKCR